MVIKNLVCIIILKILNKFPVIEKFEDQEGRKTGETSAADLPNVQKLRKELCDAQVNLN